MKTTHILIISFLISVFFPVSAQDYPFKMSQKKLRIEQLSYSVEKIKSTQSKQLLIKEPISTRDENIVSIIDIGTSANAYSFWKKLSYLWVNPEINTVVNIHRRGGALDQDAYFGDLAYDISKNGGRSWEITNVLFDGHSEGEIDWISARYPQICVFNPDNSSDPNDSYVSYFAPSLYNFPNWDYVYGVGSIGDTSYHTQNSILSDDSFYQNIPQGFDMTSDGNIFVLDKNMQITDEANIYMDSLIVVKGEWSEGLEDFIYERELLEANIDDDLDFPVDYQIAFGPDGQTAYIVIIANNGEAEQIGSSQNLYPIYWKTTDGGQTWSEPNVIQLDGNNGLYGLVNHHLLDEQIVELFGDNPPPREEIAYTTAYDCDIMVDKDNNLHIAVVVGPAGNDPYSIVTAPNFIAAVDIFSLDGGDTWYFEEMGRIKTFRGDIGDIYQDNRIQITTTPNSDLMFISWLDTDMEDAETNDRPNIFVRGFNFYTFCKTNNSNGNIEPTNVTMFSEGMWEAFFAIAPKFCFEFVDGVYTIPYVYVEMDINNLDPLNPVQFKYIQDFTFSEESFLPCPIGVEDQNFRQQNVKVIGNSPNPFLEETDINIELFRSEDVKIIVNSITGQQLEQFDFGKLNQGKHTLTLKLPTLNSGIYFYTLIAGQYFTTAKFIVK